MRALLPMTALAAALAACGGGPTAPSPADALSGSASSAHYDFHFADGDAVDSARQEAFHDWIVRELAISPSNRLHYNKYRDRAHMKRVTGKETNGFAEPSSWTVHSIWAFDAHEALHVYTALIGRPSDFFNEGIAVALSSDPMAGRFVPLWSNTPIDDVAKSLMRQGTLPPVDVMATTGGFRNIQEMVGYPAAGSFVAFMIRERGIASMRTFFQTSGRDDSLGAIQSRFEAAFGSTLTDADQRWRSYIYAR